MALPSNSFAGHSSHHNHLKRITDSHSFEILNVGRNALIGSASVLASFFAIPFAPRFVDLKQTAVAFYLVALLLAFCAVVTFFSASVQAVTATGEVLTCLERRHQYIQLHALMNVTVCSIHREGIQIPRSTWIDDRLFSVGLSNELHERRDC